jgi:hypothetical protein
MPPFGWLVLLGPDAAVLDLVDIGSVAGTVGGVSTPVCGVASVGGLSFIGVGTKGGASALGVDLDDFCSSLTHCRIFHLKVPHLCSSL